MVYAGLWWIHQALTRRTKVIRRSSCRSPRGWRITLALSTTEVSHTSMTSHQIDLISPTIYQYLPGNISVKKAQSFYPRVLLATTKWDKDPDACSHQEELVSMHWKQSIEGGSKVVGNVDVHDTWEILEDFLDHIDNSAKAQMASPTRMQSSQKAAVHWTVVLVQPYPIAFPSFDCATCTSSQFPTTPLISRTACGVSRCCHEANLKRARPARACSFLTRPRLGSQQWRYGRHGLEHELRTQGKPDPLFFEVRNWAPMFPWTSFLRKTYRKGSTLRACSQHGLTPDQDIKQLPFNSYVLILVTNP